MKSWRTRIDRFISEREQINRRAVHSLLAQGRIKIDGEPANSISQVVGQFSHVTLDDDVLLANTAHYIMLHKPAGVVSASRDRKRQTVIDLISTPYAQELHLVGRLDFNSTGLLLLTNDGQWSRAISHPENSIVKTYRVRLAKALTDDYVDAFAKGMYFAFEGVTTRPATLKILSDHEAEVGLFEGRYHQIKRMFGRFDNEVLSLHRIAVGNLPLDSELAPGEWRQLPLCELQALGVDHCAAKSG